MVYTSTCLFTLEITNLPIGKLLVLQTKRSNQIAVLKWLNDKEGSILRVEVFLVFCVCICNVGIMS